MPRLSDKHIAAIRAAAEDNDQTYGFGDVILLCDELQTRRAEVAKPPRDLGQIEATAIIQELIKCVEEKQPLRDADVLALFHALQREAYFKTVAFVDREALTQVLNALTSQPHLIRELQATRGLPLVKGEKANPIDLLIDMNKRGTPNAAD